MVLGRQPVDLLQRRVDRHVAQIGVQDGQPDGGLGDHPGGQGHVPLQPPYGRPVCAQPQRVDVAVVVQQPHVAELHETRGAVLAPDGEGPGPALAGDHDVGEQLDHQVEVLFVHHDPGRVLAEGLLGRIAEQLLGLRAPQRDASLGIQDHGGHAEHVEQPARPDRLLAVGHRKPGCTHSTHRLRPLTRHAVPCADSPCSTALNRPCDDPVAHLHHPSTQPGPSRRNRDDTNPGRSVAEPKASVTELVCT